MILEQDADVTHREEYTERLSGTTKRGQTWKTSAHRKTKARSQPSVDIAKRAFSVAVQAPSEITTVLVSTMVQWTNKHIGKAPESKKERTERA